MKHNRALPPRQQGEPVLHRATRCACGRTVDAGWTTAIPTHERTRCLICETADLMRGFVWPRKREVPS